MRGTFFIQHPRIFEHYDKNFTPLLFEEISKVKYGIFEETQENTYNEKKGWKTRPCYSKQSILLIFRGTLC